MSSELASCMPGGEVRISLRPYADMVDEQWASGQGVSDGGEIPVAHSWESLVLPPARASRLVEEAEEAASQRCISSWSHEGSQVKERKIADASAWDIRQQEVDRIVRGESYGQ